MSKIKIPINLGVIEVDEGTFSGLTDLAGGDKGVALAKVASWVKWFLAEYAKGGCVLSASDVRDIESATGETFSTPREIVKAVQKSQGRDDGQFVVRMALDPVYEENLKQLAEWQSSTPDAVLSDLVNYAVGNGWLAQWAPSERIAVFAEQDFRELKQLVGKDPMFGADIMKYIRETLARSK